MGLAHLPDPYQSNGETRCEEARQEGREEDHQEEAGEEGREEARQEGREEAREEGRQEEVSVSRFSTRLGDVDFLLFGPVTTGGRGLAWVMGREARLAGDTRCLARACCEPADELYLPTGTGGSGRDEEGLARRPAAQRARSLNRVTP